MLEEIDIEILNFIYKQGKVSKNDILKRFPESEFTTSLRLKQLEEKDYKHIGMSIQIPIENTSYILSVKEYFTNSLNERDYRKLDIYYLSDLGKMFIQDHFRKVKKQKKIFLKQFLLEIMRSIFCPLIVALLTTLITLWFKN